jgi:hypothetical protein
MVRIPAPISRNRLGEFSWFTLAWLIGGVQFLTSGFVGRGGLSDAHIALIVFSGPLVLLLFSWTYRFFRPYVTTLFARPPQR